jgi:DNA-binding NarL/FixJ family response regulator
MALDPASRVRVNLEKASVLLLDDNPMGMSILVQIITGLGARHLHRCGSVEEAREAAVQHEIDLAIVDSLAPAGGGYDFVRWLRTEAAEPNCFAPVMVTTSHTPSRDVARARDCGGHIIIKKPIAPIVMLERILWVSKGGRSFLYSDDYVGPDSRFKDEGAPGGIARRREDRAANDAAVAEVADAPSKSQGTS